MCYKKLAAVLKREIAELKAEIKRIEKIKYIVSTVDYSSDDLDKALKENERLRCEQNALFDEIEKITKRARITAVSGFADKLLERAKATRNYFEIKSLVTTLLNETEERKNVG